MDIGYILELNRNILRNVKYAREVLEPVDENSSIIDIISQIETLSLSIKMHEEED